jgi:hypothetical protein
MLHRRLLPGLRAAALIPTVLISALALSAPSLAAPSPAQGHLYSVTPSAQFPSIGADIAGLDDLNGDGIPEWIEGGYSGARVHSGADGSVLYAFPASVVGDSFGSLVLGLEDIDADGVGDFLIGGFSVDADFERSGVVYVFSGRQGTLIRTHSGTEFNGGFGVSAAALKGGAGFPAGGFYAIGEQNPNRVRVFAGYSGAEVYTLSDSPTFSIFGSAIANVGDLNQDGFDDLGVAFDISPARVQVFAGGSFQAQHPMLLEITDEDYQGPFGGYTYFGRTLASPGDVNGDGVPDLVLGAPFESSASGASQGVVRAFDGATGRLIWSTGGETVRFASSVEPTGDHDGDGVGDVLVGGPGYQGSLVRGGGSPEGGNIFNSPPGSLSLLSGATGRKLALFRGDFGFDYFGSIAASIGDVTGDGLPEIAISSFNSPETEVRVFRGDLCPQPREYCASLPNSQTHSSSTTGARLGSSGSVQLSSNDLTLWVEGATRGQSGAFFLGTDPNRLPVGDGILCVGGPRSVLASVATNPWGIAVLEIADLPQHPFDVGASVFVQYAFRDLDLPGGTGLNFSNGLALTTCP